MSNHKIGEYLDFYETDNIHKNDRIPSLYIRQSSFVIFSAGQYLCDMQDLNIRSFAAEHTLNVH